jgi:hypothetical protein
MTGQYERVAQIKREVTPPDVTSGGVYESQPKYNPDVVHHGEAVQEDARPEQGTAKNLAARWVMGFFDQ